MDLITHIDWVKRMRSICDLFIDLIEVAISTISSIVGMVHW